MYGRRWANGSEFAKNINSEIKHNDIRPVRKAMSDKRRQVYPVFPKYLSWPNKMTR